MPELPDVEVIRRRIAEHGLEREIASVDLRDPERLRGARPADLDAALTGYRFTAATRHGKVLALKVSCGWNLIVHFGMTGALVLHADAGDEPDHTHLACTFADGGRLAYADLRRLGWLELTDDVPRYLKTQDIGPDALSFTREGLSAYLADKGGTIKSALMDQSRVAGIGNVYSDEILFGAGVRPDRKTADLDETEVERVFDALHAVLTDAVELDADPGRMTDGAWLLPHRDGDGVCPRCGGALTSLKVSGRTTHLCPRCQT
ncbi:formamidopyrimidine-DNA glycosylase [Limimonas halophila]|uniref:Formamidopyrimidine-DNA glycosylase n=1 Tax=Limimonas halophila TaxID=1082479 RepID=A0A1G7LHW3_9PROT|nr:DNA-formamidopyrimidine glycosylase family protein [Limimonas halophila]SDF48934.1 formamidopyrimidine-DNA glycosylase [Limimonas halophila]